MSKFWSVLCMGEKFTRRVLMHFCGTDQAPLKYKTSKLLREAVLFGLLC